MARLVAPPAAAAPDVPALVPVPLLAAEVAADVEAPAADELELGAAPAGGDAQRERGCAQEEGR